VLSALATGYAGCDQWFASAPAGTLPNRMITAAAGTIADGGRDGW
jgi:phospholipase C